MATFHKANEYFQKKYAESLRVLEKYNLKATIKHTNHEVRIHLTSLEGGNWFSFDLQHSWYVETASFTMRAIDTLADDFFAAFPKLVPMLESRNAYVRINGVDLHTEALNSLHKAFHEMKSTDPAFDADVDEHWMLWDYQNDVFLPMSSKALKALESLYAGASICHSAQSMLAAFMTQPSTKVEALTPGSHRYALDGSIWFLSMQCDGDGWKLIPAYEGQKALGAHEYTTAYDFTGHLSFFWSGIQDGFLTLSWDAMKAAFNIDRALYDTHASCSDDPLVVLKACLAQLQLDSGRALESLAADFKLGTVARRNEERSLGKVSKYNAEFQEQFEDALAELATYGLKARLRQNENEHLIWMTYGSKPFAVQFVETIELDDMSEETLEEVGSKFCDALQDLFPMLQARKRYMDLSGKDLDLYSVASLHEAWDEDSDYEEDVDDDSVPVGESWYLAMIEEGFTRYQLELMTKMYVAGTTMYSKYSALESFLSMPCEPFNPTPEANAYSYYLNECYIGMTLQTGPRGVAYTLDAGGASNTKFEVANVNVDGDLEISLPPTFWNTVHVSWAQLEKRFGISKELFDVHMQLSTGLLEALKSAYHHVQTKPMTDAMVVAAGFDFNDAAEPVGDEFPAESNAADFAIQA